MPRATYLDNGGLTVNTGSSPITPSFPATVNADDMLILGVSNDAVGLPTTPAGWTLIDSYSKKELSFAFYWLRAVGTESGTLSVTIPGTLGGTQSAIIHRIGDVITTGTPYDDLVTKTSAKSTTVVMRTSGTPTVDAALDRHFSFVACEDDAIASHTTANWIEESFIESASGDGVGTACYSMVYASGIDELAVTLDSNKDWTGGVTFNMLGAEVTSTYTLSCTNGSFALGGKDISLLSNKVLNTAKGSFALDGKVVALNRGFTIPLSKGSFLLDGKITSLLKDSVVEAERGTFLLDGKVATFTYVRKFTLSAEKGSFSLTGKNTTLSYGMLQYKSIRHNGRQILYNTKILTYNGN